MFDKIVIVTRKSRLDELVARFNTRGQAKFYIEHSGGDFAEYDREDTYYKRSLEALQRSLSFPDIKLQIVDREFLPNFIFRESDIVVALGQDGLVANVAKYIGEQPLIGVNPDPGRYDGILVPHAVPACRVYVQDVIANQATIKSVSLAEVTLNDGQRLLAFNDLFIGPKSHISARYRLTFGSRTEAQSSSGIIVSTGAGSTGWLSSIFNMVSGINQLEGMQSVQHEPMRWDSEHLFFVVREPFLSKHSAAGIVAGNLTAQAVLTIESEMPTGGTIFSDGVESDFLDFNAGAIARVGVASRQAKLVVSRGSQQRLRSIA